MSEPPRTLLQALAGAGLSAPLVGDVAGSAPPPAEPGAYLLLLHLPDGLVLAGGRHAGARLPAGWVLYAGSARGPGGLRARVGRHLRRDKPKRWHVDWITTEARASYAMCFTDRGECDIVAALADGGDFVFPLPGLGSSDCRVCTAHVLCWTGR